jgi:hypothetical protein
MTVFAPYTARARSGERIADPINLLFYDNGHWENVVEYFGRILRGWRGTSVGSTMYASIEDGEGWRRSREQFELGWTFGGTRLHIRIFGTDEGWWVESPGDEGIGGAWSLAAVHLEYFQPGFDMRVLRPRSWELIAENWHRVYDWMAPRDFVAGRFRTLHGLETLDRRVTAPRLYQGVRFDGVVRCIRLPY